jgi:hypothetical protein
MLEHAGTHAALEILAPASLQDDRLNAALVKKLCQQQPGRAGADDGNLGTHALFLQLSATL